MSSDLIGRDHRREQKRRNQRIRAGVLGLPIAIAVGWLGVNAIRPRPSVPADDPMPAPTDSVLPRDSEVLRYPIGELVAVDPQTGEELVIVEASDIAPGRILNAAWSADGRWVAFDVSPGRAALWVVKADVKAEREPRPFAVTPGPWAWSPTTAQLAAVESGSEDGDSLILIDAATGDVVDLGRVVGDLTTLAWSPDGTQIAYGTLLTRHECCRAADGSVYVVNVEDGSSRLLAEDVGYTYGIGGTILWSPDGNHVAIVGYHLYLMDADGSGLRAIDDGVQDATWSSDGTKLAYATFPGPRQGGVLRIWTVSPEDEAPFLVHEEPSFTEYETADLAWSPDGTQIAFTTETADERIEHKVIPAKGAGDARDIDELVHLSWGDRSYFCRCYG